MQGAVDEARAAGAEFVVLLAHLGQTGQPSQWRSDTLVSRCEGINVVIDGHSHEEYVQIVQDRNGDDVVIAQTGTQFSSVGQIVIIGNGNHTRQHVQLRGLASARDAQPR